MRRPRRNIKDIVSFDHNARHHAQGAVGGVERGSVRRERQCVILQERGSAAHRQIDAARQVNVRLVIQWQDMDEGFILLLIDVEGIACGAIRGHLPGERLALHVRLVQFRLIHNNRFV